MHLIPADDTPLSPAPARRSLKQRITALAARRIVWVLGDQGVVSVGNFVTFNLLARGMARSSYGAFGVVLETIIFLNSLQAALVIYPMTLGCARDAERRIGRIVGIALCFTLALLPLLGTLTAIAARTSNAWPTAICAIFALFMWQVQETTRRGLMADMRFRSLLWGDTVSYLGQAVVVFLLGRSHGLTAGTAFLAMGGTSLIAACMQAVQLKVARANAGETIAQALASWRIGRWTLLSNMGGIVTSLGYLWTLRFCHGLEAVAGFTALFAVTKLMNPVSSSLCGIITPAVARAAAEHGARGTGRIALKYGTVGLGILFLPFSFAFVMPELTLRLLYGTHSAYVTEAGLLRIAMLAYLAMHVNNILNAWLTGLGESRASCVAQGFVVGGTALIALPMTAAFGLAGLVWGSLMAACIGIAASSFWLFHVLESTSPQIEAAPDTVGEAAKTIMIHPQRRVA
jgi:O-antigen/teichoic acid export membrane protein